MTFSFVAGSLLNGLNPSKPSPSGGGVARLRRVKVGVLEMDIST